MSTITLGFGAVYLGTALLLLKKQSASEVSTMIFIVTALVLLAAATWIQFSGFTIVAVWALEAAILIWCGVRWKKRWVWLSALGLFGLAILKFLLTPGFMHLSDAGAVILLNPRGYALAALTAGFAFSAYWFGKLEHPDVFQVKRSLQYGWIATLFLLISIEIGDHFLRLIGIAFGEQKLSLALDRNMFLAAAWMLYSMPLLWFGLKRQVPPLFLSGIGMISIAVGLGGIWAMTYSPIERFTPFTNIRAGLLGFLILSILLHTQWLAGVRRRYHRLEALMHFTWVLLLFELCTVETNDYFRRSMEFASEHVRVALVFGRFLTLAAVWMVFSLPIVRLGLARKMRPTLYLGLWALLLSISMAAVRGLTFDPIENYSFLLNYRSIVILLVLVGSFVHATWIKYSGQLFGVLYEVLNSLRVAIVLLLLILLTAETRDFFEQQQFLLNTGMVPGSVSEGIRHLENLKQVSLSGVWLVFSIVLMGVGIWRRLRTFRLIAIGLFAITIAKVFFYDLSFLETLYRIFSFIGLGLILLAVSYLYRRYKVVILEPNAVDGKHGKEDIVI